MEIKSVIFENEYVTECQLINNKYYKFNPEQWKGFVVWRVSDELPNYIVKPDSLVKTLEEAELIQLNDEGSMYTLKELLPFQFSETLKAPINAPPKKRNRTSKPKIKPITVEEEYKLQREGSPPAVEEIIDPADLPRSLSLPLEILTEEEVKQQIQIQAKLDQWEEGVLDDQTMEVDPPPQPLPIKSDPLESDGTILVVDDQV